MVTYSRPPQIPRLLRKDAKRNSPTQLCVLDGRPLPLYDSLKPCPKLGIPRPPNDFFSRHFILSGLLIQGKLHAIYINILTRTSVCVSVYPPLTSKQFILEQKVISKTPLIWRVECLRLGCLAIGLTACGLTAKRLERVKIQGELIK